MYSHANKNNVVSGAFGQMQEGSYYNIDDVATTTISNNIVYNQSLKHVL